MGRRNEIIIEKDVVATFLRVEDQYTHFRHYLRDAFRYAEMA